MVWYIQQFTSASNTSYPKESDAIIDLFTNQQIIDIVKSNFAARDPFLWSTAEKNYWIDQAKKRCTTLDPALIDLYDNPKILATANGACSPTSDAQKMSDPEFYYWEGKAKEKCPNVPPKHSLGGMWLDGDGNTGQRAVDIAQGRQPACWPQAGTCLLYTSPSPRDRG